MDYDVEIKKLIEGVHKTLQGISNSLILTTTNEPSIGYLQILVDELSDHVKWMNAKLYTVMYLTCQKKKIETGKENG